MKKLGIIAGFGLGLFVALALILPQVIEVDRYRPKLVETVKEKIQGDFEIGHLSLSLWGQIRIAVDGVKLKDVQGREVLAVKDAYFHVPFVSILSGSPILSFKMNHPSLNVVRDKMGVLNVVRLMKSPSTPTAPASSVGSVAPPSSTPAPGGSGVLPAIVTRARLGLEMRNALVQFQDEGSSLNTQIKDLNLIIRDISMSRPLEWELWADLNTELSSKKSDNPLKVKGPIRLSGVANSQFQGAAFALVKLTSQLDLDRLSISLPGIFIKEAGIPAHAEVSLTASPTQVQIDSFTSKFLNMDLDVKGIVYPLLGVAIESNEIQLGAWAELIPRLKENELRGSVRLGAKVTGPSSQMDYQAQIKVSDLTAKVPRLKAKPVINGIVKIQTDKVEQLLMTLEAPGSQLKLEGKVVSFSKPRADFQLTSPGMDLDQWVEFPPSSRAKAKATVSEDSAQKGSPGLADGSGPAPDYDALIEPLRKNPIMREIIASMSVNIKQLKAYQVQMTDLACKMNLKDLTLNLGSCGMKLFKGDLQAHGAMQLKPTPLANSSGKAPTYQFGFQAAHLNLSEAVQSQMALFKNTLQGSASFSMEGQGSSFNPDLAIPRLKAKGRMKVEDATFATIDIMKMVQEAINQSLKKVAEKVPGLNGKSVGPLPDRESRYEVISSDFVVENNQFKAPNFIAKAAPNQGVDLRGSTQVTLKTYGLETAWEVQDTYNLTHMKDISAEVNGVKVEHIFSEGQGPFKFPIRVNCSLMSPCYSYTEIPEYLAKVALKNIGNRVAGKAAEKVKEELKKKAESLLDQVLPHQDSKEIPSQIRDRLKGIFN